MVVFLVVDEALKVPSSASASAAVANINSNASNSSHSNWASVTLEEEQKQQQSFIRSNDSRLYSIPSPSSIPLPPPQ